MESLFYQNLQKVNNETVLCNILGKSNTVILFGLDKLTHLFFSEHFPTARFFAAVSPQIEYFSVKSRLGNNRKLYANLHPESVDLFALTVDILYCSIRSPHPESPTSAITCCMPGNS